MTPERFGLAATCFHVLVVAAISLFGWRWRRPHLCQRPITHWTRSLIAESFSLLVGVYVFSLLAAFGANWNWTGHIQAGQISLRLLGQALFIEGPILAVILALNHRESHRTLRAATLSLIGLGLAVIHVDAYYIEPQMLVPRHYSVGGSAHGGDIFVRILHISDIQTPTIGAHEERALRTGMSYQPDLIVLTGDYVQNALGRSTELAAAKDLRALMSRIGFTAPLGVFATEGDVGPACGVVFAGTQVRCLANESVRFALPNGDSLGITGLTRGTGRERDPAVLGRLIAAAPPADHRIVISHSPDFISAIPIRVDLVLAGHTHGGQVVIPFFGPPRTAIRLPRRFAGGLNDYFGIPLHVSRGVGMERGFDIPIRFLCPPEIGILDLHLSEPTGRAPIRRPLKVGTGGRLAPGGRAYVVAAAGWGLPMCGASLDTISFASSGWPRFQRSSMSRSTTSFDKPGNRRLIAVTWWSSLSFMTKTWSAQSRRSRVTTTWAKGATPHDLTSKRGSPS